MLACFTFWSYVQHALREEVKERVKWMVNRDSAEDKTRDFLEWTKAVKNDTLHNVRIRISQ